MKKCFKIILSIIVILIILIFLAHFIFINYDKWKVSRKINDINNYAIQIENISIDDNVKIVALGEATHGNKEFQELKLELFKVLVKNNNYKVFVLEADFGECLYINDYIHGNSKLSLDEVLNKFSFNIYHTNQIKDLIKWMKSYNDSLSENDKVSFYGFDLQNPEKGVEYIINNLKGVDTEKLNVLVGKIKLSDENVRESIEYLKTLSSEDKLINYAISNILNSYEYYEKTDFNDYVSLNSNRDALMKENITWIYNYENNKGNNKIMISGHNGHISKYEINYTNMGSLLKNEYDNKYYVVGTDYFNTNCNIAYGNSRINLKTNSSDILAYQAKYIENEKFFIDFNSVDENSDIYSIINSPIFQANLGENYNFLMKLLPQMTKRKVTPIKLYDGMIFVYNATPLEFN